MPKKKSKRGNKKIEPIKEYDKNKPIYDRQSNESTRKYRLFCLYREMGPTRSVPKVREIPIETIKDLSKMPTLHVLQNYSKWYKWGERASAYDDYIEKQSREKYEKEMIEINGEIIKISRAMVYLAAENLQKVKKSGENLNILDIVRLFRSGADNMQKVFGTMEKEKESGDAVNTNIDPEREKELQEIFRKAGELELGETE